MSKINPSMIESINSSSLSHKKNNSLMQNLTNHITQNARLEKKSTNVNQDIKNQNNNKEYFSDHIKEQNIEDKQSNKINPFTRQTETELDITMQLQHMTTEKFGELDDINYISTPNKNNVTDHQTDNTEEFNIQSTSDQSLNTFPLLTELPYLTPSQTSTNNNQDTDQVSFVLTDEILQNSEENKNLILESLQSDNQSTLTPSHLDKVSQPQNILSKHSPTSDSKSMAQLFFDYPGISIIAKSLQSTVINPTLSPYFPGSSLLNESIEDVNTDSHNLSPIISQTVKAWHIPNTDMDTPIFNPKATEDKSISSSNLDFSRQDSSNFMSSATMIATQHEEEKKAALDNIIMTLRSRLNREFNLKNSSINVKVKHDTLGIVDIQINISNGDASAIFKGKHNAINALQQHKRQISDIFNDFDLKCTTDHIQLKTIKE